MKPKIIWILNHHALPPYISGGTRHFDIASELVKNDYKVVIFASSFHYSSFNDFKEYHEKKYLKETISDVEFIWFKTFPYSTNGWRRFVNMFSYIKGVKKYLKRNSFEKPDIIIGSTVHLLAVNLAYKLAERFKSKFIIEVRDFWPYTLVALGKINKNHPIVLYFNYLEKKLYPKANTIISLFDKGYMYFKKFISEEKVICLPNSFNETLLKEIEECDLDIDQSKFILMYTGAIGIPNDLFTLIKAFELISDESMELHIIGEGKEKNKLLKYINDRNLSGIYFHPPVAKKQIQSLLRKSDVLWAGMQDSKLYEFGFSFNKIYDYMASAKPIILSSNVKNNIIDRAGCGPVVSAENVEELRTSIESMKKMPENKLKELGNKGKSYILKNLTTKKISKSLIENVLN